MTSRHVHGNRLSVFSSIESLEDRRLLSVTTPVATIREATAAGPTANTGIQATVDAFRADLGTPVNGNTVGSQGAGRREITWDGGDNDAAPARLPNNFFNAIAPRGVIFNGDPRIQFQVGADTTPAVPGTLEEFGNVNATYPTAFAVFSSPRLFTSLNSNVVEVEFVVPGTLDTATVSGFGAVFTDVDTAGSTKIEYFDVIGNKIFERDVLATAGDESLSFLGVTFTQSVVGKVRITAGSAALGPNDITQGGTADIVVMDDFIYGEPQPHTGSRVVVSADKGGLPEVRIFEPNGTQLTSFTAYSGFRGGIRVATGDVNGDGVDDIITAPGKGIVTEVRVFDGTNNTQIAAFAPFGGSFRGGAYVAAGNVNGDASIDIIVSRDKGNAPAGEPHVRVFAGDTVGSSPAILGDFFAYAPAFKGGVTVAAGDTNGDFLDDIVVGKFSGGSDIRVVDATQLNNTDSNNVINAAALLSDFSAFEAGFAGGVYVAAGDVNGDGIQDIVAGGNGRGSLSRVRTFDGSTDAALNQFIAYEPKFAGGVRVAVKDVNGDGIADIVTGAGRGTGIQVRHLGVTIRDPDNFFAFDPGFAGGVYVA